MYKAEITARGISEYLGDCKKAFNITVFDSLPSTNSYLRSEAVNGAPDGRVTVALAQSAGRGRLGRSFISPAGSGLYMSLLVRRAIDISRASLLTPLAAVAVCDALHGIGVSEAVIKWVNDIYIDGRKVCGILTDSAFLPRKEPGRDGKYDGGSFLGYAVIGFGVNLFTPAGGFPPEISERAGSIFNSAGDAPHDAACRIAAGILRGVSEMLPYLEESTGATPPFVAEYRKRSFLIGRSVTVIGSGEQYIAHVTGIDNLCRLLLRLPDGRETALSAGEVSITL